MMSFTVGITDEIWNAFVDAYERNRGTTSTTYNELHNETCKVMCDAIKAYGMSSKEDQRITLFTLLNKEQWKQFKEELQIRAARISPLSDEEAEEHARQLMFDALTVPFEKSYERDMALLVDAYEIALNCPAIHIKKLPNDRYGQSAWDIEAPNDYGVHVRGAADLLREVKAAKEYVEKLKKDQICGQDVSVMIPVHDWIWQDFKEVYAKRHKDKAMTDKDFIEIVHDWACRAMQYYTRYNMEDPWTLVEAYEIALSCPEIQLKECDVPQVSPKAWNIAVPGEHPEYSVDAEGPNDLYRKLKVAKEYAETLKKSKKEQSKQRVPKMPEAVIYPYDPGRTLVEKSRRNVIREAYEIAETCPAMIIEELKHGWSISFEDDDYSVEALDAVHLLAEVKEAKAYWEASQKSKKTSTEQTRDMIRGAMEKAKIRDEDVIRIDGLDQETKELLLHFIEHLTIKEASDILQRDYPCSVWDELHFIRERLRTSIEQPRE